MNAFSVVLTADAFEDIRRLDTAVQRRIFSRLPWLGQNVHSLQHHALRGPDWRGGFRFRIGGYRIIYEIDWAAEEIRVLKVGHRSNVYG
jgi:mRNA interferase RelE/StbE